ncbi:MAG: amidohydrolase family protein [Desulfuromonadales bacterium]|nr:amidohydrolase family protein [Desulfuromonadales bacterium]
MKVFRARYLLPIDAPLVDDGALLVAGGRILAAGSHHDLAAAHPGVAVVDFGDAVILPPMVNAHTHLELTNFPQWAQMAGEALVPDDFVDWILQLVRVRRTVGSEAVRASLFEGLWDSLAAGTGAVGDILTTLAATSVYAQSPMQGRIFCEVLGVEASSVEARLAEVARCLAHSPAPGLSWGLSPHAPYTLNRETLGQARAFAGEHCLALAMHWAETAEEVEFLATASGPLERLYAAAGWKLPANPPTSPPASGDCGGLLIHAAHLKEAEIDDIARAGLGVVLCPRSNSRFGEARAPLKALRRAGVPLALGTDSRASSPSLSIWAELAFARAWFAGDLDPVSWLAIATTGGAAALGLSGRMGRLASGLEASFQVIGVPDGATPATLVEALCAEGHRAPPQALFLNGECACRGPACCL